MTDLHSDFINSQKQRTSPNIRDYYRSNSPKKSTDYSSPHGLLQIQFAIKNLRTTPNITDFARSICHKNNIFITIMGTPQLNYIIQTQLSKLTTTDSQKNSTTPHSNAHYETILPKMKHSAIILVQLLLV